MPPQLLLAAAMAGQQVFQSVWNGFSGNSAVNQQRLYLDQQRRFSDQQQQLQTQSMWYQRNVQDQGIAIQEGNQSANLAQSGVIGESAGATVQGNVNREASNLDNWQNQTMSQINLAHTQQQQQFEEQSNNLDNQEFSNYAGMATGVLGAGMSFLTRAYNPNTGKMAWDAGDPGWTHGPAETVPSNGASSMLGVRSAGIPSGVIPGLDPSTMDKGSSLDAAMGQLGADQAAMGAAAQRAAASAQLANANDIAGMGAQTQRLGPGPATISGGAPAQAGYLATTPFNPRMTPALQDIVSAQATKDAAQLPGMSTSDPRFLQAQVGPVQGTYSPTPKELAPYYPMVFRGDPAQAQQPVTTMDIAARIRLGAIRRGSIRQ